MRRFGDTDSYAESLCTHDWVLNLDADEVLKPELREEIRAFFVDGAEAVDAVRIPIFDVFPSERQKPAFGYSVSPGYIAEASSGMATISYTIA